MQTLHLRANRDKSRTRTTSPQVGATYHWKSRQSGTGKIRSGEIRAKSVEHARYLLKGQGISPTSLRKTSVSGNSRVPLTILCQFSRQLAVMIQSGVPLTESLGLVANSMNSAKHKSMRMIIRNIRAEVESGLRLSEAMSRYPKVFDNLFCNTLAAGEDAGQLEDVLNRLALHLEKSLRTREKIRKAMLYPLIVMLVAATVTVGMLVYVLPTFKDIYGQFKTDLPSLTLFLLAASDFLKVHGHILLGAIVVGLFIYYRAYTGNPKIRSATDSMLIKLPIAGEILRLATFSRWNRTFATLSQSGVPITEALDSVSGLAGLKTYRLATAQIRQDVTSGLKVSESMEKTGKFPHEMSQMIRIGEESGRLDQMLDRLALQYETKLDDLVDNLSTIMEPVIMCIIGVVVGTMIIGMYLPIFNMGNIV